MQHCNTVDYVSKKYALRECPVVLAQLLSTSRVRLALSQTNCYLDVQSRVLNWRHRATLWTKGAIVEVAGPTYEAIDHCNNLIETIVPFYASRRPYSEILPNRKRHVSLNRQPCQRTQKAERPSSSIPVEQDFVSTQMSNTYHQPMHCQYTDHCMVKSNHEQPPDDKPKTDGRTAPRYAPMELRKVRYHTLCRNMPFTPDQQVKQDAFVMKINGMTDCEQEMYLDEMHVSKPTVGADGKIHDQNEHNVTNTTELPLPTTNPRLLEIRRPSIPKPSLFESRRSGRIVAHSVKASAMRAGSAKMKNEKLKLLRQTAPPPPKAQKSVINLNKSYPNPPAHYNLPHAETRESVTKPTGDINAGLVSLQVSAVIDEKASNAKLTSIKGRGEKGGIRAGYPSTKQASLRRSLKVLKCSVEANAQTVNAAPPRSKSAQIGSTDQAKREKDNVSKTHATSGHLTTSMRRSQVKGSAGSGVRGGREHSPIIVANSEATESGHVAGFLMDNCPSYKKSISFVVENEECKEQYASGEGRAFEKDEEEEEEEVIQGPMYAFPRSRSSSSTSRILLSNTPMVSDHDIPDASFIAPMASGECRVKCTRCVSHNMIHTVNKTFTDTAEFYLKPMPLKPGRQQTRTDSNLISDVSSTDMKLSSWHIHPSALVPSQTVVDPQSVSNGKDELAPKPVSSTVLSGLPVVKVIGPQGTKINVPDTNYAEQVTHLRSHSPRLNRAFQTKLFKHLEGYSYDTTETHEVFVSEEYKPCVQANIEQVARRSELRSDDPLTADWEVTDTRLTGTNPLVSSSTHVLDKSSKETRNRTNTTLAAVNTLDLKTIKLEKRNPRQQQSSTSQIKQNRSGGARSRSSLRSTKDTRDAIPPSSPNHTVRSPKESEMASAPGLETQRDHSRSPVQTGFHSDDRITSVPMTSNKTTPVSRSKMTGPRNSKHDASKPRLVTRELTAGREQIIRMPKFNSTPRTVNATVTSNTPRQPDSRPASKTSMEHSVCDSAALTPSHLPRPSPTSAWLSKARACKGELADPSSGPAASGTEDPVGQKGELPQHSLRSACPSVDRAPSAASTDVFIGFRSPDSCQVCESPERRSAMTSSLMPTDQNSTERSSDEMSTTTTTESDEGTPYPFPERKSGTGPVDSVEKFVDPAVSYYHNLTQFSSRGDRIKQYESRSSYRVKTKRMNVPRRGSSMETRAMCESYDYRMNRYRSQSVYSKVLRCLSLQWCFGD